MEWKSYSRDILVGGIPVPIRSLRIMDELGNWKRYRVSTVQEFFAETFTKLPAWAQLTKDGSGRVGVMVTGAYQGLVKIGRLKRAQVHLIAPFNAVSKKAQEKLLKQFAHEIIEEADMVLAREKS
ncbi:MAG: hypothetical protein SVW57_01705 [Thermodesulfobacteriota bacterium]|nr:hypothetical protein [Thermodesulfobacteriota bacterium]